MPSRPIRGKRRLDAAVVRSVAESSHAIEALEPRTLLSHAAGRIFIGNDYQFLSEYTTAGREVKFALASDVKWTGHIAVAGSRIFVADAYMDSTIKEYSDTGQLINAGFITDLSYPQVPQSMVVSRSGLYILAGDTIVKYSLLGQLENGSLITGLRDHCWDMAIHGQQLFVTNTIDGTVGEYTTSGQIVNASFITGLHRPMGIAVSDVGIFVTNQDGTIGKYTLSGQPVNASLVSGVPLADQIAVSGSHLFVTTRDGVAEYTTWGKTVNARLIGGQHQPTGIHVEDPAPPAGISGAVYDDLNGDGIRQRAEKPLPGVTVTLRQLKNGQPTGTPFTTVTDRNGVYGFDNLAPGDYKVAETLPAGFVFTKTSGGSFAVSIATGSDVTHDFANVPHASRAAGAFSAAAVGRAPRHQNAPDIFLGNYDNCTGDRFISRYSASGKAVNFSIDAANLGLDSVFAVSSSNIFDYNQMTSAVEKRTPSGTLIDGHLITGQWNVLDLCASGSDLYVMTQDTIGRYTTAGQTVNANLITGLSNPNAITVAGSDIFVLYTNAGSIAEYTTSGQLVNAALITGLNGPQGLTVSGSMIYVANQDGTIGAYTTAGKAINPALVSGVYLGGSIAVHGSNLFVSTMDGVAEYTTAGKLVNPRLISGLYLPILMRIAPPTGAVAAPPPAPAVASPRHHHARARLTRRLVVFNFVADVSTWRLSECAPGGQTVKFSLLPGDTNPNWNLGIGASGSKLFVPVGNKIAEYTAAGQLLNDSLISNVFAEAVAASGNDLFVLYMDNDGRYNIGEYTTSGQAVNTTLIASLPNRPDAMAVSGNRIYLASSSAGLIAEYTTTGRLLNGSFISGLGGPNGIAVRGSDIYVTGLNGAIGHYTTAGKTVNAAVVSGVYLSGGIAVSGSDLFVTTIDGVAEYLTSGRSVGGRLIRVLHYPTSLAVLETST